MVLTVEGAAERMFGCTDGSPVITQEVEVPIQHDDYAFVAVAAIVDIVAD